MNPGLSREVESQAALHSYLSAPDSDSVELLNFLIVEHASPIVKRVVRNRFASSRDANPQDQEDVRGDSLAAVIGRVKALRAAGDCTTVEDFGAYVAGVASQIANRFFLARSPQRTRLRNRLRYILTTDKRFRIRQAEHGAWLCSLDGTRLAAVPTGQLPVLAHRILVSADGPLELSALTTLAADALGVIDRTDSLEDHAGTLLAPCAGADRRVEIRQRVAALWKEVCLLPVLQRVALLLNSGSGEVWLIPDLGIATFRELAASLEMTAEELAAVWSRIPLADQEIAERLKVARQQVINLRSAARQRLLRRMPI